LRFLLKNDDLLSADFVWQLAELENLESDLKMTLTEHLGSRIHSYQEHLDWVNYQVQNQIVSENEGFELLKAKTELSNESERYMLAEWASAHGLERETAKLIDNDMGLKRKDYYLLLLRSLSRIGEWERVYALLEDSSPPLDSYWLHLLKSNYFFQQEQEARARQEWYRAKIELPTEVSAIWSLIRLGDALELFDATDDLLEQVLQRTGSPDPVINYLGSRYLETEQFEELYRTLKRFHQRFPGHEEIANEWVYYAFLLKRDMEEAENAIEDLYDSHPERLRYHMTWALGRIQAGDYPSVLERLRHFDVNWSEVHPKWRFILALALLGVGESEQAHHYLNGIDVQALSIPEQQLLERLRSSEHGLNAA